MRYLVTLAWFLRFLVPILVAACCSKSPPLGTDEYEIDWAKNYLFTRPLAESRSCQGKTAKDVIFTRSTQNKMETCKDMLPGLQFLTLGTVPRQYAEFGEKAKKTFYPIYGFSCPADGFPRTFQNKSIPDEILSFYQETYADGYAELVTSATLIKTLVEDAQLRNKENDYIFQMPQLRVLIKDNVDRCAILEHTIAIFKAILRDDIKILDSVQQEYMELPFQLSGNEHLYYNFQLKYGTHAISAGILGGRLLMAISSTEITAQLDPGIMRTMNTIGSLMKRTLSMKRDQKDRFCVVYQGGISHPEVETWKRDVKEAPALISSENVRLSSVIEEGKTTQRTKNFDRMWEWECTRNLFKRIAYLLSNGKENLNKLGKMVIDLAENEANQLCPSSVLKTMIEKGVEEDKNFQLDKFELICGHDWINARSRKREKKTYRYPLIQNLCLNMPYAEHFMCNLESGIQMKNIDCLRVFEGHNCNLASKNAKAYDKKQIKKLMPKAKSLMLC